MRNLVISLALLMSFPLCAENNPAGKSEKNKNAMKAIVQMQMKRFGGRVRQPNSERGDVVYVNSQKLVDAKVLEKVVKRLANRFHFVIRISDSDVESSCERVVIRLEDLQRKESVLMAPEDFWISVNVRSLMADNPPMAILENRFEKEALRAFAFVCGGTCSTDQGGLCTIVDKVTDLDTIAADKYSPDVDVRIVNNMRSTGVRPYRVCKYSEAVQEGWAPQPTNEFQKAIWDKVHASPTKPMKIKFDPAAQKGKVTK